MADMKYSNVMMAKIPVQHNVIQTATSWHLAVTARPYEFENRSRSPISQHIQALVQKYLYSLVTVATFLGRQFRVLAEFKNF